MNFLTELREGLAISWDAIRANKMRAGLTTLGIVIGIVTVTLMGAAIQGLNAAFLKSISAIGTDVLYIQKFAWFSDEPWWKIRNRREIWLADGRTFMRLANPEWKVSLESISIRTIKYKDRTSTGVILIGDTEEAVVVNGLNFSEGRFLSAAEVDGARPVCVIGADLAKSFFAPGPAVGNKIKIGNSSFEVVGVVEKRGKFLGLENLDNTCYVPVTRFVAGFVFRPGVRITVKVGSVADIEDAKEEIRGVMRKVRRLAPGDPDDFAVNSQDAFIKTFNRGRADARDRHPQGHRRQTAHDPDPVPDRSLDHLPAGRVDRIVDCLSHLPGAEDGVAGQHVHEPGARRARGLGVDRCHRCLSAGLARRAHEPRRCAAQRVSESEC
jgi:putative ABC transport system permease protein